jgi:hypothetical protein
MNQEEFENQESSYITGSSRLVQETSKDEIFEEDDSMANERVGVDQDIDPSDSLSQVREL